jgi:two-component system, sensor histidine kinase and response regulator
MDVQMPVMSGLEASAGIRAYERTTGEHVAIIAMTAHAMEGDRARCLNAGMDDYVTKPVRLDALRGALERVQRCHVSRCSRQSR